MKRKEKNNFFTGFLEFLEFLTDIFEAVAEGGDS